jgi:hypothetical protein
VYVSAASREPGIIGLEQRNNLSLKKALAWKKRS